MFGSSMLEVLGDSPSQSVDHWIMGSGPLPGPIAEKGTPSSELLAAKTERVKWKWQHAQNDLDMIHIFKTAH